MVPGAVSNARWMARAIYVLKCFLFRYQLEFEDEEINRLRRFSMFISAIYVRYWNWCPNVFNAPINDLQFLKDLENYREVDEELANLAIDVMSRHLTYLSDELVVLSIFSNQLHNDQKEAIRLKLSRTVGPRTEHSIRHINNRDNFSSLEIPDFISNRSMFLLKAFDIDDTFLMFNASDWNNLESYQRTRQHLKDLLTVVNDAAERALGQTANAINHQKARTEENLQNLLCTKLVKK